MSIPFSAGDPDTFVDLGSYELRSTGSPGTIDVCNTSSGGVNTVTEYAGGNFSSTAETRDTVSINGSTCAPFDYNGSDTLGRGDFRIMIPADETLVFGLDVLNFSPSIEPVTVFALST